MMQKHMYNDKINSLKEYKKAASPEEQIEIDFTIFGMKWAFGENTDESLHKNRMALLFSTSISDKRKGEAYRKGMDIVLYGTIGRQKEKGTVTISKLRIPLDIERGLNNIKEFFGYSTLSPVRKSALRWYIEMMGEKHGKDFFK